MFRVTASTVSYALRFLKKYMPHCRERTHPCVLDAGAFKIVRVKFNLILY